jgi:hypothetical protein
MMRGHGRKYPDQYRVGDVETRAMFPRENDSWAFITTSERMIVPQAMPVATIFPAAHWLPQFFIRNRSQERRP